MMRIGTVFALVLSLAGGAATSQAPEIAQQYRQRLHGALEELRQVVERFEEDAARHALGREEALALYERSETPFMQDQGRSLRGVLGRFEHLDRQAERLAELPPVLRPLAALVDPDGAVLKGALRDFEPAVPLTAHGLLWTAAGMLAGLGLARLLLFPVRPRHRAGRRRRA